MTFQLIAWACKVPLADPVERCALIWFAGRCTPLDWMAPWNEGAEEEVMAFAGVEADRLNEALAALQDKGLLSFADAGAGIVVVRPPQLPLIQLAEDEWDYARNDVPLPEATRKSVLEAAQRECAACSSHNEPQVDHIVPRVFGGTNDRLNLQVLCSSCNRRKRDKLGWVDL